MLDGFAKCPWRDALANTGRNALPQGHLEEFKVPARGKDAPPFSAA
jgi:hypothetical protein